MIEDHEWKRLCSAEWSDIGIKIMVGGNGLPDLSSDDDYELSQAADEAVRGVIKVLRRRMAKTNPKTAIASDNNRKILEIFDKPIFVEEIQNGYCDDVCCEHLPWFVVTTKVGRITIGKRKRVFHIDWEDTVGTCTSAELFEDEDVTKDKHYIHAWSVEDAKRYVDLIIMSANL